MATIRMVAGLVRSLQTVVTFGAVMMLSVVILLPSAVHADTYGAGMYGNDVYNGSGTGTSTTSTTSSGGGTCSNCSSSSGVSHTSTTSTSSTSTVSTGTNATTSVVTTGGNSTTTTPFICASVATGGDLSLAQLVNLFVSLGIIPADKAQKACNAVAGGGVTNELPLAQFSKSLKLGDRDLQVHMLQAFLNTHGFVVATSGPGSSGNETDLYGSLTKNAVARFQVAYEAEILTPVGLTSPSGIFGPSSMKKANALIGR